MSDILAWIATFFEQLIPTYILPNLQMIFQIVVLVVVAVILGRIVKIISVKILVLAGLKRIAAKTWAGSVLKVTGYKGSVVEFIADLVKWLVYILFLAIIIQTLGLPGVADIFTQIAIFIPRFIGAVLIMVIGFMIADFFGKVFEEASRRFIQEETMASLAGGIVKYSIALIALIMALSLIGLETASLSIMFALIFGTTVAILVIGVKDTFPNFTAGIQLRGVIKPGEYIEVLEYAGVVERIEPLNIILRDGDKRISVPNALLLKAPLVRKKPQK